MLRAGFSAVLLLTACGFQERIGEFEYDCHRGGGMLDGNFCEAELGDGLFLEIVEGGAGPFLQYRLSDGAEAGVINHRMDEERPVIARAGANADVVVVETTTGRWYLHPTGQNAPGVDSPLVRGPFTRDEFAAQFGEINLPPMRSAH